MNAGSQFQHVLGDQRSDAYGSAFLGDVYTRRTFACLTLLPRPLPAVLQTGCEVVPKSFTQSKCKPTQQLVGGDDMM